MPLSESPMSTGQKIIVLLILVFGFLLRFHNYDVYPQRGATSDEYAFAFLGVSLLTKGVPISWSAFGAYQQYGVKDLTIRNLYFPMVQPYFDHPPLTGILVGAWSLLFGQDTFEKIDLKTIRLVPIFFSLLSSVLIFFLTKKLFGYTTALWALLIYSTATLFVVNGRVVFAENLLTPFWLFALYLFVSWKRQIAKRETLWLGLLAAVAFWMKIAGIVVFLSLFFLYLKERIKPKWVIWLTVIMALSGVLYIVYGAFFDRNLFFTIWQAQASRAVGPQTLLYLLSTPLIVNKIYFDGWYFFGFLALFLCFLDFERHKYIVLSSLVYLLVLLATLTQKGEMGWYMIPLFPFMAIASARVVELGLTKYHWLIYLLVLLVGNYLIQYLFTPNFGLVASQYRGLLAVLFGPLLWFDVRNQRRQFTRVGKTWFYLFLLATAYLTYAYVHPA